MEEIEQNKSLSKKEQRRQKRLEKQQKKDFERYGIKPEELQGANKVTNEEARHGYPSLRKCLKYFKNYKRYIFAVVLCALVYTVASVITPIINQHVIDYIAVSEFQKAILYAIYYLAISLGVQWICYFWNIFGNIMFAKVIMELKNDIIYSVATTKTKKFDQVNSGTIIARVNGDTEQVSQVIGVIIDNIAEIFVAIGFIIYLCFVNIYLGLFIVGGMAIIFIGYKFLQDYLYRIHKKRKVIYDKQVGMTTEIARGIRDIKSLNIKDNIVESFNRQNFFRATLNIDSSKRNGAARRLLNTMEILVKIGSLLLGIYLLSKGMVTIGGLLLIILYFGRVMYGVTACQRIVESVKNASVAAERICEIMDDEIYPKEKFGSKTIKNPKGEIEFKNVFFSYDKTKPVFENLNLKIEPNESVAFVGKSGQGKSTLLSLIPKLYELDGGKITIDGVDITKLSENGLRDLVTVVPQTPYIFNASIRENLKFVKEDLTDEEMFEVCKKAQIHDFIMSKEKGYDSLVGENGVILSGGQKQRLAIARALLKNSKIILLDEATSALDNENQSKIQKVIEEMAKEHTVIIVAHRLSTVVNCKKIYMIENGKIVDSGTHDYMMKNCKAYKNLYKIEKKSVE